MSKEDKEIFASNLRKYIAMSGMQQQEIADKLKVNRKTFNGWCHSVAMPKASTVQAIARFFNIEMTDLLNKNDDDYIPESYYLNNEAKDLARFMHENPKYKVLFDAARNVQPEDIELVKQMLDRFGGNKDV